MKAIFLRISLIIILVFFWTLIVSCKDNHEKLLNETKEYIVSVYNAKEFLEKVELISSYKNVSISYFNNETQIFSIDELEYNISYTLLVYLNIEDKTKEFEVSFILIYEDVLNYDELLNTVKEYIIQEYDNKEFYSDYIFITSYMEVEIFYQYPFFNEKPITDFLVPYIMVVSVKLVFEEHCLEFNITITIIHKPTNFDSARMYLYENLLDKVFNQTISLLSYKNHLISLGYGVEITNEHNDIYTIYVIQPSLLDKIVHVVFLLKYQDEEYNESIRFTMKGVIDILGIAEDEIDTIDFLKREELYESYNFPTISSNGVRYTFTSSNTSILSNSGVFNMPLVDGVINLTLEMSYQGNKIIRYYEFKVRGINSLLQEIIDEIVKRFPLGVEIYDDLDLVYNNTIYPIEVTYNSLTPAIIAHDGTIMNAFEDRLVTVRYTLKLFSTTRNGQFQVKVMGHGDYFQAVINWANKSLFNDKVNSNRSFLNLYQGVSLTWESSNPSLLSNIGSYNRPKEDEEIDIICHMEKDGEQLTHVFKVIIQGLTPHLKIAEIELLISDYMKDINVVNTSITLYSSSLYQSVILWTSSNSSVISYDGDYKASLYDFDILLIASVTVEGLTENFEYKVLALAGVFNTKWEEIEAFVRLIAKKEITTISRYTLYGYEVGYEYVPTRSFGYLPFYFNYNIMSKAIVEIPNTLYSPSGSVQIRSGRNRTETRYIVIHNTGMAHPTATAQGVSHYFQTTERQASWHYSIDDNELYQSLPLEEIGWHAGDGSGVGLSSGLYNNGIPLTSGNNFGVGIESCVYAGVDFDMVMRNLAKLTAELLIYYSLNFDDIKQHYNFSGKDCPQVIRQAKRWDEFLTLVKIEYYAKKHLSDVEFEWVSLSSDVLDDKGRIFNHNGMKQNVSYKVIVRYNSEIKEYTFTSNLHKIDLEAI